MRLRCLIRYRNASVDRELVSHKRDGMLLVAHSTALLFNMGKVVVTKNPFLINASQIFQVVRLALRAAKESADLRNRIHLKTALSNQRTAMEMLRTAVLLDKAVILTNSATPFFRDQMQQFEHQFQANEAAADRGFAELEHQLLRLADVTNQIGHGGVGHERAVGNR